MAALSQKAAAAALNGTDTDVISGGATGGATAGTDKGGLHKAAVAATAGTETPYHVEYIASTPDGVASALTVSAAPAGVADALTGAAAPA